MSGQLTVPELARLIGKNYGSIMKAIQRGKYQTAQRVNNNKVGQGGKIWQINIKDPAIPPEIRAQYYRDLAENQDKQNNDNLPAAADGNKALVALAEPSAVVGFPETHLLSGSQGQEMGPPSVPGVFSEKAKRIALARMDLLRAWKEYRKNHQRLMTADGEFLTAYTAGLIQKNLHDILGNVSIKTLYKWDKELDGTSDWKGLVPLNLCKKQEGAQLSEDEQKTFLNLVLNPRKFRIGTAIRLTKTCLENKGIPSHKSPKTFYRFADKYRSENYDLWVLMREGQKALKDKVEPFIKRDPSLLEVGDVLIADGHRLNFQVINPFKGKPCRAVLVGYLDWKSYDLVGYEIMVEENTQCIALALRNSIIRLGKFPKVAYQDNGKAFRSKFFTSSEGLEEIGMYGLFGRLGITPVFAQPYNARAKPIERFFGEFSSTCERLISSYTGSSISDKPAWLHRNEKFHRLLHNKYVPKIEEAIQFIDFWLTWHRSQPCPHVKDKTIGQVFEEGKGPGVNIHELDELMLAMKITKIGRKGIRFLNADYYDDNLYGLRQDVVIKYSLFDLSHIEIYDLRGQYLCTAKRVMPVHPMANYFGDAKDIEALKQALAQQRTARRKTNQEAKEFVKSTKPLALGWEKVTDVAPRVINKLEKEKETLTLPNRYINIHEAIKDFIHYKDFYLPDIYIGEEEVGLIEDAFEKKIKLHELDEANVEDFVLELRAQLERRATPIGVARSIIEKSIPFIEFLKRLIEEVGPISKELNQQLRAEYGDSIEISKAEEVIEKLRSQLGPESPKNHNPIFQYGWQRYEFLNNKESLSEEEKKWIGEYKEGRILPGEFEEIYIKLKQQNDSENNQRLAKREAI